MNDRTLLALDLAAEGKWEEARALLDVRRQREEEQRRALQTVRHEVGNMLTIAQANVEGMLDGVVEPTLERLEGIRDALQSASERLKELIGKD